ncbi:MAG TPA: SAM-dependent methyltransferase [Rhizomicrobium sp.]|nr:SAM-dependent methyltransferase [Rhizomicrobium sp.]
MAEIVLAPRFGPAALAGLSDFSHLEVIFHFDQVPENEINTGARHPRGRTDWPLVGIFAQRGRNRPNRIGVSTCRLLSVEGTRLKVSGLDAVDGTPVLDIKPVMTGFLPRGVVHEPEWVSEVMRDYW